jgi:hypothetical protein
MASSKSIFDVETKLYPIVLKCKRSNTQTEIVFLLPGFWQFLQHFS